MVDIAVQVFDTAQDASYQVQGCRVTKISTRLTQKTFASMQIQEIEEKHTRPEKLFIALNTPSFIILKDILWI